MVLNRARHIFKFAGGILSLLSLVMLVQYYSLVQFRLNFNSEKLISPHVDVDGVVQHTKRCLHIDPSLLHEKLHFRWENNEKVFVTMKSLLEPPDCILCDKFCKENNYSSFDTPDNHKTKIKMDYTTKNDARKRISWRLETLRELGEIVQRRLTNLQTPQNCSSAKKIGCRLHIKNHGFASELHHVSYCLLVAYAKNRTLVLKSDEFEYGKKSWEEAFLGVSKCSSEDIHPFPPNGKEHENPKTEVLDLDDGIIGLPRMNSWKYPIPDFIFLAIPEDLSFSLTILNDDPSSWWIGQFAKYIFRLQPDLESVLREEVRAKFKGSVAGMHVRRTDKLRKEANYRSLEEYMSHVEIFFNKGKKASADDHKRHVFLASDDPSIFKESEDKYPSYDFIFDSHISEAAKTRGGNSLIGIIHDVYLLTQCDFVVCTLSSNICRLVYELQQAKGLNVTNTFRSLDEMYYLSKKTENRHVYKALESHFSHATGDMNMSVGDILERMVSDESNRGYRGKNLNKNTSGFFPVNKVKRMWPITKLPVYADIN